MIDTDNSALRAAKPEALKSLQVLRAIAAVSVVYYHIGALPSFGSFGVDIFFVLSGFVIAMVLAKGQSPSVFAASRLIRVVPLYWLLTSCLFLIALLAPELLNSTTANLYNYAKSLFFIPYFKENGTLRPLLAVGWTLNYEMFFYLCIWLSILLTRRYYLQLSALLVLAAYGLWGQNTQDPEISVFLRNTQLLEFLLGILVFKLYTARWPAALRRLPVPLAAALGGVCYLFMAAAEATALQLNGLLIYGIPSALLLLALLSLEGYFSRSSSPAVRCWTGMGDASYATYLSHFYVVELIRKIAFQRFHLINPYTPLGVALVLAASLLLGYALYRFIDRPLLRFLKARLMHRRATPGAGENAGLVAAHLKALPPEAHPKPARPPRPAPQG